MSYHVGNLIVSTTSRLLKGDPKNPYLRGKLVTETKEYNKLVKLKNKQFVDNMFMELDSMEKCNPRGYMELVKSMRDGGFDKAVPDDTSSIPPSSWHIHFSNLLAKKVDPEIQNNLKKLINEIIDNFQNELSEPFSTLEYNQTSSKTLKVDNPHYKDDKKNV